MKEKFLQKIKYRIEQFFEPRCGQCGKVIPPESLTMVSKKPDLSKKFYIQVKMDLVTTHDQYAQQILSDMQIL